MADSPSSSVSPSPSPSASASPSPSPAFDPTESNITAIEQSDDLVAIKAPPTDIIVID